MVRRFALALIVVAAPAAASGTLYGPACYQAAAWGWPVREALDICGAALRDRGLSARDRGALLVNRGVVQLRARRYAGAVADFDAALAVAPGMVEALVDKGIVLVQIGRSADALPVLTDALAAAPDRADAYYTRAMANEDVGKMRAAYDDYTRAAALAPGWAEPVEQLRRFSVVRRPTAQG